jgi:hypothetical protein
MLSLVGDSMIWKASYLCMRGCSTEIAYLLNTVLDTVASHQDLLLLAKADSARNGLALYAGIPLRLDYEDTFNRLKI